MPWLVIGGSAIASSLIGSRSASSASSAQTRAAAAATAEERRQFDLNRQDTAPYREAGALAVNRLTSGLGLGPGSAAARDQLAREIKTAIPHMAGTTTDEILTNFAREAPAILRSEPLQRQYGLDWTSLNALTGFIPRVNETLSAAPSAPGEGEFERKFTAADFQADPVAQLGLQFGLDEGRKGINNLSSASGLRKSGATLKALTRFGEDYGSTKAGESYNRFYGDQDRTFNRLAGLSGTGQTAATNTAALGSASTARVGDLITGAGNARGAASIARGNAWGQGFNTIGNFFSQNSMLDKILNRGSPPSDPYRVFDERLWM